MQENKVAEIAAIFGKQLQEEFMVEGAGDKQKIRFSSRYIIERWDEADLGVRRWIIMTA